MRSFQSFSLVAVVLSFAAVALESSPALAVPCCSAPMCTRETPPPPPICGLCSDCSAEQVDITESGYDEEAGVCLDVVEPDPTFSEDVDASEVERVAGCE
jgi:hypothetical protein